jgi:glucokinase
MAGTDRRSASRHLGLDLGGTNIKVVVMEHDDDGWRVLDRDQVPTPAAEGPDRVVARLAEVGAEAISRSPGVSSVGIGIPGLYDPAAGTTRFLVNIPGAWDGKAVAGPVGDALGLPAALINDARAFGLAELRLGAGRDASAMIGLTLGTGVGGVIAIDGRVYQGRDGTGGELGHQTLDPDGPTCGCGNRGCLEAYTRADRIAEACGVATVEEAVARARAGEPQAREGLERVGRYLGVGIANMITVVTPQKVVIGGGVAAGIDLLLDTIRDEVRRHVFTTTLDGVEIVPAELGTWAGAIGAAIHGAERAAAPAGAPGGHMTAAAGSTAPAR